MKQKLLKNKLLLFFIIIGLQQSFAQNTCATALPVTAGIYTIDVIDGTNITATCSNSSMAEWYAYTPTQNYTVTVTSDLIQNICKDTYLAVFTGSCTGLTCYASDDDSGVIQCNSGNSNSYLSTKTFDVIAGTTYYITWANRWQTLGFDFQIIENPFIENPCSLATLVTAGITTVTAIDGNNINTTCSTASMAKWYKYIPTGNFNVKITSDLIQNICKDTNFSVYTGSCTSLSCIGSDDNSGIIACNSGNTNSNLSTRSFDVNLGTTYYIAWDNKWSAAGFDFQIIETPIIIPITYTNQTIPTASSNYNICVVDMNGDHKDDLVGVSSNNLKIHYQTTPGVFTMTDIPVLGTSKMPSWSMAAGDYNKDGFNDLVLGSGNGLSVWTSNSTGTAYTNYTPGEYIFCQRTNFIDLNQDGNLDIFSCHDIAPNAYYLNDSTGNLTYYQSTVTPGAMSIGAVGGNYATLFTDFDNDGDMDVFISKCSGPPCEMHINNGDGTYTDVSAIAQINITPIQTWSSAIADFDNDGDMDIIITASSGTHKYFRNNLDSSNTIMPFTNITAGSGWDTNSSTNIDNIAYDFDNDGYVDVLGGGNKIMFNKGDGTFAPTNYPGLSVGAVGDFNNDGFLDIMNGSTLKLAVPNGNNWLKVTLQGIESNSNGIGARVEIYGAFGKKIRDIRSGEGFKYMSSLNAHFGIGLSTAITQVIVRWPSGIVDTINNPTINSIISFVEGSTLAINDFSQNVFKIYPNPANNVLNINAVANIDMKLAQIYDLNGRLINTVTLTSSTIDIQSLANGTYILMLRDSNGKDYSQKFIKE